MRALSLSVSELARLTGLTVRTLHHYDELGLLSPPRRSSGHRVYGAEEVTRLHRVLTLRELGLSLSEIAIALSDPTSVRELLKRRRGELVNERARLEWQLAAIDRELAGQQETTMTTESIPALFDGFDPAKYDAEVEQRWGQTEHFKESQRRTKRYTKADWQRYEAEAQTIAAELIAAMKAGEAPSSVRVQAGVERHRLLIDRWFYPCDANMHRTLGAMYVSDARFTENLDRLAPGYAAFLSEAIAASA